MMQWGGHAREKSITTSLGRRTSSLRTLEPHANEPTPKLPPPPSTPSVLLRLCHSTKVHPPSPSATPLVRTTMFARQRHLLVRRPCHHAHLLIAPCHDNLAHNP